MPGMKTPDAFEAPFLDGTVRHDLKKVLVFGRDRLPNPDVSFHQQRIAEIRGTFQAAVFPVFNELVLISMLREFGSFETGTPDRYEAAQKMRRKTLGEFHRLAGEIASGIEEPEERREWGRNFAELVKVRNALAHQPFWLEPITDPNAGDWPGRPKARVVSYEPYIADDDMIWLISDDQVREWHAMVGQVLGVLVAVRMSRSEAAEANRQDGPPPRSVWIMIPPQGPVTNPKANFFVCGEGLDEIEMVPGGETPTGVRHQVTLQAMVPAAVSTDAFGTPPNRSG